MESISITKENPFRTASDGLPLAGGSCRRNTIINGIGRMGRIIKRKMISEQALRDRELYGPAKIPIISQAALAQRKPLDSVWHQEAERAASFKVFNTFVEPLTRMCRGFCILALPSERNVVMQAPTLPQLWWTRLHFSVYRPWKLGFRLSMNAAIPSLASFVLPALIIPSRSFSSVLSSRPSKASLKFSFTMA
jgi:hypothetical protein